MLRSPGIQIIQRVVAAALARAAIADGGPVQVIPFTTQGDSHDLPYDPLRTAIHTCEPHTKCGFPRDGLHLGLQWTTSNYNHCRRWSLSLYDVATGRPSNRPERRR